MERGVKNLRPAYHGEGAEEAARQRQIVEELKGRSDKPLTFYIATMGCQMNARDSEKLRGILEEIGCRMSSESEAELVLYNTCCVRENAEQRLFGRLGQLKSMKRENPSLKIALCGCMMQEDLVLEKLKRSYPEVDLIFGTYNIYKFPELLQTLLDTKAPVIDIWQEQKEIVEDLPSVRRYAFKSSVNIMYGCDNFCSFCIVPYVRGRERSREARNVLEEVKALAEGGVKEIQLLGQNVNSYGKGLSGSETFAELLQKVSEVPGIERIRFMSSHPKDLSEELMDAMRSVPKVCPHFHLPLQSGSSRLLGKMNRRYTKERYLELVEGLRARVPDIAITTDIIVGFPTETREDFLETLDVVRKARFSGAFTFLYSIRQGTVASRMEQVDPSEAKENFQELLDVLEEVAGKEMAAFQGRTAEVLAEEVSKNDPGLLTGRDLHNHLVHFPGGKELIGQTVRVSIEKTTPFYLLGRRANG